MKMGSYFIIEGDEGSGKTTQVELLAQRLRGAGREVQTVREPGGDPLGEVLRLLLKADSSIPQYRFLRDTLLGSEDLKLSAAIEALAFLTSRLSMRTNIVYPMLACGTDVVSDRGEISTLVYQGLAGHVDMKFLRLVNEFVANVAPPTVTIVLDVPLAVSQARQVSRGLVSDRFESRGEEYRQAINDGYRQIAGEDLWPMVDANQSVREVHEAIWSVVRPLL